VLPANFLYYFIVWTLAFFNTNIHALSVSSIIVLSASVAAKVLVTRRIFFDYFAISGKHIAHPESLSIAALLLAFAFSLPGAGILQGRFYLGQLPPNVWHNSTAIFLMPFVLLLFWTSYKQLIEPQNKRIWLISLLNIVGILIKPNFFLVFGLVYPLFLITRMRLGVRFWLNVLPILVPGVLFLTIQYFFFFGDSGVKIALFSLWSHYSPNIPLSLMASTLFPLTYVCLYWRKATKNLLFSYSFMLSIASVIIFSVFSETGSREFHGNFGWQFIICNYILFAVTLLLAIERNPEIRWRKMATKDRAIFSVFLAHVIYGLFYLGKMLILRDYG